MVRPWNEVSSARIRLRFPAELSLASLNAASLASVPEFVKNTRPAVPAPVSRFSRAASSSWGGLTK